MLRIIGYDDFYYENIVGFFCETCKTEGDYDITDMITDNCALDIDVQCRTCHSTKTLFFLKCTNPALAKDLNAELEVLKIRRGEAVVNGNQNNGEVSDRGIQTECC